MVKKNQQPMIIMLKCWARRSVNLTRGKKVISPGLISRILENRLCNCYGNWALELPRRACRLFFMLISVQGQEPECYFREGCVAGNVKRSSMNLIQNSPGLWNCHNPSQGLHAPVNPEGSFSPMDWSFDFFLAISLDQEGWSANIWGTVTSLGRGHIWLG